MNLLDFSQFIMELFWFTVFSTKIWQHKQVTFCTSFPVISCSVQLIIACALKPITNHLFSLVKYKLHAADDPGGRERQKDIREIKE